MKQKLFVLLVVVSSAFTLFGCSVDDILNAARDMGLGPTFSYTYGANGEIIVATSPVDPHNINLGDIYITYQNGVAAGAGLTYEGGEYKCLDDSTLVPILNQAHLQNVYPKVGYCLSNNIALEGDFEPIGDENVRRFLGTFDGQYKTITGLNIVETADEIGLFRIIGTSGEVKNLTIKNPSVKGHDSTGVLAGINKGTITNVRIIVDSSNSSVKVEGNNNVGGLVGSNTGEITNSSSSVAVTGTTTRNFISVGGLVGQNSEGTITNSYASGTVAGEGAAGSVFVGGLVGSSYATITNSYASGTGTGTVSSIVGGLVGSNNTSAFITNSYFDNNSIGQNSGIGATVDDTGSGATPSQGVTGIDPSATGTGGISGGGKQPFQDAGWEFPSIWFAKGNGEWPRLAWQTP